MSDEDWKGEHFIRGVRPDRKDQLNDVRRVMSGIYHEQRRQSGEPAPAWRQHRQFYLSTLSRQRSE